MNPHVVTLDTCAIRSNAIPTDTIHGVFEAQAAKRPKAQALKLDTEVVDYAELNKRANRLAHKLQACGVGPESPVALYLERSVEMVVSILAVLKAGGAYVPIDMAYPPERIAFMLEDSAAPVVLTQSHLRHALPGGARQVICLDEAELDALPETNPSADVIGENAAYIIYTSGSTGKPKGVIVTHANVVRLLRSTEPWYGFNDQDIWPLFHSYSFDMSVWELWGALFYGGRLIIVPHAIARSPEQFYALLAREKVTFLNQTPSAFRQLIWADQAAPKKLDLCLRFVTLGGEALELQSLRPWFNRRGDRQPVIVNMYGITETTVHTTYRPITWKDLEENLGSVIGVPIPDLQVHLLDEHLKPVPQGLPGEICVGGAGVARGYLNRPELNALRFVPDPFTNRTQATLYRSGDLARVNDQGEMEYLGRMDHQVKIRGFRVELGEIESTLNRHLSVRESVVVAIGEGAEKRLAAYFVPAHETPNTTELRAHLAPRLPDYMMPAAFVALSAFPLTNNGKIDRRALPLPESLRPELSCPYVPPEGEKEQKLANIWAEVLGVHQVGRLDNFFELGGDSIRAITLLSLAREQGCLFTLEQLFNHPSVAAIAANAQVVQEPGNTTTEAFALISATDRALLPEDIEDAYPIAALQLGMFFHNEMDPLSAMYHDVFSFRVGAGFEPRKLNEALQAAAARHPTLRTSFHLEGHSQPLQRVHSKVHMPFSWEDLRELAPEVQETKILDWIETEKRHPFRRETPPLMRFHVQQLGRDRFQLFISFHHCCTDGWSLAALITEILRDYASLLGGKAPEITSPRSAYRDFVALERQATASPESITFWKEHLAEASRQSLPRWPRHMRRDAHEQTRGPELQIDAGVLAGLKRLARTAGVPLKTVLLAAHQRVMATLYGQFDVVTGLVSNGRPEQSDGDKLIGLFLNTIPFRQKLQSGSWVNLVKQTFATENAVLPHRRFPMAEIQKLHGRPVTETAFDFVHFHVYNELKGCAGLEFAEGPYFEANNLTTYTTFMLDASSTRLELHIDYDPTAITREQIEQIDGYYLRTLKTMASAPESDCLAFSPLAEEEKQRMLLDWNRTARDYPAHAIHELFEARAASNPDAIAVACGTDRLTYKELDEAANRLAEILANSGVSREALVGVCVDRSPRMVVALLGILKAGAAYVPLDPAFPRERLEFMIEDAQLQILVTEEKVLELLPDNKARAVVLDRLPALNGSLPARRRAVNPRDLAYVIYTSGSTGKPKGVQVEHRSVVNLLISAATTVGVSQSDNLLAVTTLSFDIAGLELFMPLICGATVTIADRETVTDGLALGRLIAKSEATLMQATPSAWRLLIEAGWKGMPGLRIICGGEALSTELASELLKRAKEVWNFYGPTETTIWSTACKVDGTEPISIGRPLANTCAYVLDSRMQPLPVGTPGELWLGGHGLARGYLGRPELTAERFVSNPFADTPGGNLYRTGDLARLLPDGRIECLGRLDQQVKIRGYRIELGEIESTLRQHNGISDAAVTARPNRHGESRLIAYVVPRNGDLGVRNLRDYLGGLLPFYMVPAQFVLLEKLPLTPNGKIDRKRLPAPELTASSAVLFVPPEGDLESSLAKIWQEVLDVPRVGAEDNIFDLGADSLSATRGFARINTTLGLQIGLRDVFENPTVRLLAGVASKSTAAPAETRIKRQPRRTSTSAFA